MRAYLLVMVFSVGLLTGCGATIPKPYDFVQGLSLDRLQQEIMAFFQSYPTLKSSDLQVSVNSACQYQRHQAFYQQGLVDAHTLVVRAQAVPDQQVGAQPYEALLGSLYNLREKHQQACFTEPQVEMHRLRFVEVFGSIEI